MPAFIHSYYVFLQTKITIKAALANNVSYNSVTTQKILQGDNDKALKL